MANSTGIENTEEATLFGFAARATDPDYQLLCGHAVEGELEVWRAEGHAPDDAVYLFSHPRWLGHNALLTAARIDGLIDDADQAPVLVYCPPEIELWRQVHGQSVEAVMAFATQNAA